MDFTQMVTNRILENLEGEEKEEQLDQMRRRVDWWWHQPNWNWNVVKQCFWANLLYRVMMDYVKMEAEYNCSKEVLNLKQCPHPSKCEGALQAEEGSGERECRYEQRRWSGVQGYPKVRGAAEIFPLTNLGFCPIPPLPGGWDTDNKFFLMFILHFRLF